MVFFVIPEGDSIFPVWTCLENDRAPIAVNPQTKEVLHNTVIELAWMIFFFRRESKMKDVEMVLNS
jgi:hypothetical protein